MSKQMSKTGLKMSKYKKIVSNYYSIIEREHDKYHKRMGYGSTEYLDLLSGLKIKAFENGVTAGLFTMDPIQVTLLRSCAINNEGLGSNHGSLWLTKDEIARFDKNLSILMTPGRKKP